MDKGFMWFALNNSTTDYVELSKRLAESIKKHNEHNSICLVTNKEVDDELFDHVRVLKQDASVNEEWKLSNEYKAFRLTPFTHTIKLEADMLFTQNTDWWWNQLCQHDQVFSYNCRNYRDDVVENSFYRKLFARNQLPDVYNGLHYFRKSVKAKKFYDICETIIKNWQTVKNNVLIACHDEQPTTDVVYALANKLQDPLQLQKVNFKWFKFMHNKQHINNINTGFDNNNYLFPIKVGDALYIGGHKQDRIVHYHDKQIPGELDARIF